MQTTTITPELTVPSLREACETARRKLTWIRERTGEVYDEAYSHQLVLEALREQELRAKYGGELNHVRRGKKSVYVLSKLLQCGH